LEGKSGVYNTTGTIDRPGGLGRKTRGEAAEGWETKFPPSVFDLGKKKKKSYWSARGDRR